MAAPKGNQNSKGKGRKSAYQERADAVLLEKMFLSEMSKDDIRKKLESGRYSLKDVFVSKAFGGNERLLSEIFRKLFPDGLKLSGEVGNKVKLDEQQLAKLINRARARGSSSDGGK